MFRETKHKELVLRYDIISKKVLNENTGEVETIDFKQLSNKTIKGGYNIMYHKNYEEVTIEVVNSNKDMKLFHWITNRFTYKESSVKLSYNDYNDISKPQFVGMIKKLVDIGYLKRVNRGIYRLNPYIYLPYKADGKELQKEWNSL